jgi:biopolymer transport protein ExbD
MAKAPASQNASTDQLVEQKVRAQKRKYRAMERKYARDADNEASELNLTAMMDMMTILLVFLIKSYGAAEINVAMNEDLTPPTSKSTLTPVQAVTVTVTKKDISVGDKKVVQLESGKVPVSARPNSESLLISPVRDALETEVEKLQKIAENNKAMAERLGTDKDPVRMLTVVGDKDMPYEILFSVLGTAGQVGLKYFKFLVVSSAG